MDNFNNSDNRGRRARGGGGRGYRPYQFRGRGQNRGSRRSRGKTGGHTNENQQRQLIMPFPVPRSENSGQKRRPEESFEDDPDLGLPPPPRRRRQQQVLDKVVLSQLSEMYPGYKLYFALTLSSIENLVEKISFSIDYLRRHGMIPTIREALVIEDNECLDFSYEKMMEDEEFLENWPSFDSDLSEYPDDVISILGVAVHTVVLQFLREKEEMDRMDSETSRVDTTNSEETLNTTTSTKKSKVNLPQIQARLLKRTPVTAIRAVKSMLIGKFITLRGAVVRTGTVKPHCIYMTFKCSDCHKKFTVEQPDGRYTVPRICRTPECTGKIFEPLENEKTTKFVVSRKIRIQDIQHEDADRGTVPRSIDCVLGNTLHNNCNAGDVITVCGIVKFHRESGGFGVADQQLHQFYIDVVAVRNHKDSDRTMGGNWFTFTQKDYFAVQEIHDSKNLFRLLVASICPTIFGHELVKAGLLLSLFGGSSKKSGSAVSRRSDINVLIVGDPGLGKSQLLTIVSEVAPRGIYVCGTATTVAGLTVTLVKDGDDYSLEAGALVMADNGVCCIDEFDKMQTQHHALLEAMEQQSVSIAKSGVFRTLNARSSVIAAANPVGGHYDARKSVSENIRINPALLSRFDLIFILVDRSDEETDRNIVNHILGMRLPQEPQSQIASSLRGNNPPDDLESLKEILKFAPGEEIDVIPHHLIRKYIAYARQYVSPVLSPEAAAVIKNYYLNLRIKHRSIDTTPVTTRQLESLMRLTQARAKLELREVATEQDAKEVLEIFKFGMSGIFEDDLIVGTPLAQLTASLPPSTPSRSETRKMAKKLLTTLQRYAVQHSKNIFTTDEMKQIARAIGVGSGFDTLVSGLNNEGYLLHKGSGVYQVQCVDV